ncbi:MAG: ATP-binding protein [Desulfobacterales bacterium]|nr:ATP-binding protein [Desulfobacterales bacterium]
MIDRKRELKFLVEKFGEKSARLIVLWGRRRVGKTYLLKEFCSQYPAIYFLATKSSKKDQLFQLSEAIAEFFNDSLLMIKPFSDWQEVFVYLKEKRSERFTLIIDEFPYLISTDSAIPSIFQKGWDEHLAHNNKIVLILNGSSISMMENEVLGASSPLYGRRTAQWKLEPFNLMDMTGFFPKANLIRLIETYSVIGGIPYYAQFFDPALSIEENVKSKILKKGEVLYQEVDFLLREEFKEPRTYFPVLSAIASGSHKFGEIAGKTGMDKSNLTKYLAILDHLHITYREVPVTEKFPHKSKKGLYLIRDPFINFWFRFVRPNLRHLEMEKIDFVWREKIAPQFDHYVSRYCEKIMVDVVEKMTGALPFDCERLGRYWDRNIEVDIMAFDNEEKSALLGEIKWQKRPVGVKTFKALKEKGKKIKALSACRKYFLLISKGGFTQAVQEMADENVLLFDLRKGWPSLA